MKILIIGADGQLGMDLCKVIDPQEQIPLTLKDLDVADQNRVLETIRKYSPDMVINTAAYHRVDECEEQDQLAFTVNALGAKNVALACRETGAAMVYISTDYVFDGEKMAPYNEGDVPNPQSAYAISKLAGEYYVKYLLQKYFIVRSSGLFGAAGCMGKGGGNFVEKMIIQAEHQSELRVVGDEMLTPTYTLDLAKKINALIRTRNYGLCHITNQGECSWYEFACKIFELLGKQVGIKRVTAEDYNAKAKRPKYSVLAHGRLRELGLDDLRPWQEALKAYLIEKGHLKG